MSDAPEAGFIVKVTSTTGLELWIAFPRAGGHRVFGPRKNADVFRTRGDAHIAIRTMQRAVEYPGLTFIVEGADLPFRS
jgi:hypothetical protein